ncbi:hypothetical protein LP52_04365 [Streptomonospora alba]|uniref:Uncharacterized protein n=1 Tax=Streptomonospora alba TaxID=183763 RepID=A0A0C2FKK9_9ACTN|nr:hypothetical protein [Streptomonospora alba]KIH99869.1 hypothetical protein LP52_04365 [Streptomonospora alba]
MIVNMRPGSVVVSGEFVAMSWDTVRSGATCAESQLLGVQGIARGAVRMRPGVEHGRFYARSARTADISRLETEPAAGTPRPKGVVGECPRGIPA